MFGFDQFYTNSVKESENIGAENKTINNYSIFKAPELILKTLDDRSLIRLYSRLKRVDPDKICFFRFISSSTKGQENISISILIPNKIHQEFIKDISNICEFRMVEKLQLEWYSVVKSIETHNRIFISLSPSKVNNFIITEVIPASLRTVARNHNETHHIVN